LDEALLQDSTLFVSPRSRRAVLILAWLLFLTAPLPVARFYYVKLGLGAYPADADSIGIPIFGFVVLWVATAPFTWGFVWLCVRRYPGRTSLAVWNRDRLLWSATWTLAFGAAAVVFVLGTPWPIAKDHPSLIAHVLLDLWFLLVLRSAIVTQGT
jgi:hypothetical protein